MSSPPCCWGSTNGSPEVIQEFVICEFNRNPHCQLVRPSSAATSCLFLTLTLIVLLSGETFGKSPRSAARFGFRLFDWCSIAQEPFPCGVCDAAVRRCSRTLADSLGELRLKGKAEPVSAWEVVTAREARSRLEVKAERGLTALVGREREMAALWDCFEKARAGQGQMVFIVGEPGIGKSRLVESNNDHAISQFAA
jgi:hypothetical protein